MKILVTGAGGQLGAALINSLIQIPGLCIVSTTKDELDISNKNMVDNFFSICQPNLVINTAAFTNVDEAERLKERADLVNHIGAYNLAFATAAINAAIIQLSTDYVFSGDKGFPYVESDEPVPLNYYGKTKLDAERAVANNNPRHMIIRTSWLFGKTQNDFYTKIRNLLRAQKNISVVDDQFGSPTYVYDLANFIARIAIRLKVHGELDWGIYHYSGSPHVSRYEFAVAIKESMAKQPSCIVLPVQTQRRSYLAMRPKNSALNSQRATSKFCIDASNWQAALVKLSRD